MVVRRGSQVRAWISLGLLVNAPPDVYQGIRNCPSGTHDLGNDESDQEGSMQLKSHIPRNPLTTDQ
jgi:hypothetical protein